MSKSNFDTFYSKKITITGDDYLGTPNGELIVKTLVNLVVRFTYSICISLPKQFAKLQDELINIAKNVGIQVSSKIPQKSDIVISIGNRILSGDFILRLHSDGWVSYLTCNKPIQVSEKQRINPIGAMGSACFGATECFKRLLEICGSKDKKTSVHPENFVFSFLDYSLTEKNSDFPSEIKFDEKILLVGAGAVGGAVVFGLNQIPNIKGVISVVDDDLFDISNLNRCLIAFLKDLSKNKADVTKRYSTETLKFESFPMKYNEFKKESDYPIVLSTVDNNEVRYEIQSDLPKLIFHGSTGDILANVSVIKFLENACLCCIFDSKHESNHKKMIANETGIPYDLVTQAFENDEIFSEIHLEFLIKKFGSKANQFKTHVGKPFKEVYAKEICGELKIQTEEGQKHASTSFVSFFAGLGVISELIKYNMQKNTPLLSGEDFFRINMFKPDHIGPPHRYQKNSKCLLNCSTNSVQNIFAKLWEIQS